MPNAELIVTDVLQDVRRQDWFWDHNAVFDSDLSANAKLVRLYLARCANGERTAFPSLNTIARRCGLSKPTVIKALKELEEKGWLVRTSRVTAKQEHQTNVYLLVTPELEKQTTPDDSGKKRGGGKADLPPVKNITGKEEGVVNQLYQVVNDVDQVVKHVDPNNTHITIPTELEGKTPTTLTLLEFGIPDSLYQLFSTLTVTDNARIAHEEVVQFLERHGFKCEKEHFVIDRGDGRRGRVDVYAVRGNLKLAIEIDERTIRKKSIFKLRQIKDAVRVVLLRDGDATEKPEGIDAVISLPCIKPQSPSVEEKTQPGDADADGLIAELLEEYQSIGGVKPSKGDRAFIGSLLAEHGYARVYEAMEELHQAIETQEVKKPLLYLKAICARLAGGGGKEDRRNVPPGRRRNRTFAESAESRWWSEEDRRGRKELLQSLYCN